MSVYINDESTWGDIKVALNSKTGDKPVQTEVAFLKKKSELYLIEKPLCGCGLIDCNFKLCWGFTWQNLII